MLRKVVPQSLKEKIKDKRRGKDERGLETELAAFVQEEMKRYASENSADPSAIDQNSFQRCLTDKHLLKHFSEGVQFLQSAMMPEFEKNLFEFYRQQQFLLLVNFLSYPYRGVGCLDAQIRPYLSGASKIDGPLNILDYGAGVPYGLIHVARKIPERIASVTIVDLDLAHTYLVEFIIERLLPNADIRFVRMTDVNTIPEFGAQVFNFYYGKDVFEHLVDPEAVLNNMLSRAADRSCCFFDSNDHGAKYLQHVTPNLVPLKDVVSAKGFTSCRALNKMSCFVRGGDTV